MVPPRRSTTRSGGPHARAPLSASQSPPCHSSRCSPTARLPSALLLLLAGYSASSTASLSQATPAQRRTGTPPGNLFGFKDAVNENGNPETHLFKCEHALLFWREAEGFLDFKLPHLHPTTWSRDLLDANFISKDQAAIAISVMWTIWSSRNKYTMRK